LQRIPIPPNLKLKQGEVMDWTQAFAIIGVLGSFVIYMMNRMERQMDAKFGQMEANQKQTNEKISTLDNRMTAMEVEIKNINQRLITIEGYLVPRKVFHFEEPSKEEPKEN